MMLIQSFLEKSATVSPTKKAILTSDNTLSYGELNYYADRFAQGLRALGVQRGDRLAIQLHNKLEFVISLFGGFKAGVVVVPLSPGLKRDRLRYILRDAGAHVFITDRQRYSESFRGDLQDSDENTEELLNIKVVLTDSDESSNKNDRPQIIGWNELLSMTEPLSQVGAIDIDMAALIYTSGSTGVPKGVMLTHRNMVCAATAIARYLELSEQDVILNVLPMSFDYGLYQVVMATVAGASVVLEKSFVYPAQILPLISEHGVTGFPIVPTIGATLLDMDLSQYDFSTLRYVSSTAAVWPYDHIVRLEKALGFPKIYSMYGLTECKRVSYLPPNDLHRKPGSVGVAIPNSEVMILNEVGHEVPPGDVGQLVVRGGHVMLGYWNAPEATERRLKPGRISGEKWLYTGDLFRRDEDGYLYFVGRVDDMIKSRGEKVSPREIEDLLHKYPGVGEAAVFGVPDIILGEAVVACVSAQSNHQLDVQNIKQYLRVHLEDYKLPRRLVELNEMPRTANGKIDKNQLKKSFLE